MAKKGKAQIWLEYAAVRLVFAFFYILPRRSSISVGRLLGRMTFRLAGRLRRVAMRNLEIALPAKPEPEREQIARASFDNLGRLLGELGQFPKFTPDSLNDLVEFKFQREAETEYERLKAEGNRGSIIVSPHLGNWELLVFAWSAFNEPINYLARPLDNPLIEEFTVQLRTRFGNRAINKTNSVGLALQILREGGILGVLPDVNSHPKEGVFVPFFGIEACTTAGVAMLAIRTNSLIVPMCGVWDEDAGKYRLVHGKIILPKYSGDLRADVASVTSEYTSEIEKLIREFPGQWLWIHKRWKTRPPGEPPLY